jgi:hypothetical protein
MSNYSARIMNLPAYPDAPFEYKEGHRDARHAAASIALEAETDIVWLRAEVGRLQRQRERLDCRYAGQYAEMSGRHCPIGDPCQRCRLERAEVEVERLREALQAMLDSLSLREKRDNRDAVDAAEAALAGEGDNDEDANG